MPSMLSLKTSISTAANAPRPASSLAGDWSIMTQTMMMAAKIHIMLLASWARPVRGSLRLLARLSICFQIATIRAVKATAVIKVTYTKVSLVSMPDSDVWFDRVNCMSIRNTSPGMMRQILWKNLTSIRVS